IRHNDLICFEKASELLTSSVACFFLQKLYKQDLMLYNSTATFSFIRRWLWRLCDLAFCMFNNNGALGAWPLQIPEIGNRNLIHEMTATTLCPIISDNSESSLN
ncbi:hypothetical protein L9F63_002542, partial [Diploptera punctata]